MLDSAALLVRFKTPIFHDGIYSLNLVGNNSFLVAGGGGGDVFGTWTEDTDGGNAAITRDITDDYDGGASCKIQSLAATGSGSVYQDMTVVENASYYLSFYSLVSTPYFDVMGRYGVYDNDNAAWIIAPIYTNAFSDTDWLQVTNIFNVPSGCTSIRLYLYQGVIGTGTPSVYYDYVSLRRRKEASPVPVQDWSPDRSFSSYRHASSVNIGYDNMSIGTSGSDEFIAGWLEEGVGRHAESVDSGGNVVWEGFVNEVSANVGGFSITVGPMVDIVNRGRVTYREIDWGTNPPIPGDTVRTPWYDNVDSQSKFGVLQGVLTGGEGQEPEMVQLINAVLTDSAWLETTQNINFASGPEMSLTINCLGYGHLLNKYVYEQIYVAGEYNISTKISDILARDPNALFYLNAEIETNTTQVGKYEDSDRTALALMKTLASMGDSDYTRHVFGVYEKLGFVYESVEEEPYYSQSLVDGLIRVIGGEVVEPWFVRPGKWLLMQDFAMATHTLGNNLREDPRAVFIESVTFTAPYGLSISGGKATKFRQKLDQLGLGGI